MTEAMTETEDTRIPVMILTGFLGAGKTTLLNRIVTGDHGRKYAVVVNEFGEIGIDNDLIVDTDEEIFEMSNGCICCTVRGDLIRTLHQLLGKGGKFDGIVIETTGIADPGPVVQTFYVDALLQAKTYVDAITTVVDAKHILLRLKDAREAVEQVAFADQIVLNKTDTVDEAELRRIEAELRQINSLAPIFRTTRSQVPLDTILERRAFDIDHILSLEPDFLNPPHGEEGHVHDEHCGHDHHGHGHDHHDHGHVHDEHCGHDHDHHEHNHGIESIALTSDKPFNLEKISYWLETLVATQGQDILRAKGIIDIEGEDRRLVFQAVHMLLEGDYQRPWKPDEKRYSRLVFIGRKLNKKELAEWFHACEARS
ncbi:MAG TPA: GTP-binding protein [Stellaceae bacterium]|nr:GTP-binding protein [Stellaceae bacterium]